jgi:GDPmannose 4,6-dehydratase
LPTALITGITGQDGSYLAELLLDKGYEVHGLVRRSSVVEQSRIKHLTRDDDLLGKRLFLHYADLADTTTIRRILTAVEPGEVYHFAGQSDVGLSFEIPESTCELTAMGTLRIMEALRDLPTVPRFLHASTREIFGTPAASPQDENTPINPTSPYGCAKAFATQMIRTYRQSYDLFFCNAICYNHESPRRGENFVTRKITRAVARIKLGLQEELRLGAIDVRRDWGYAKDYVVAMWRILQQDTPDDFVLATGQSHSIEDFLQTAFEHVDLNWKDHVKIDDRIRRPVDPVDLLGDSTKARRMLDWSPSVTFEELVHQMVDHDLRVARSE